jgi:hypothetical protein
MSEVEKSAIRNHENEYNNPRNGVSGLRITNLPSLCIDTNTLVMGGFCFLKRKERRVPIGNRSKEAEYPRLDFQQALDAEELRRWAARFKRIDQQKRANKGLHIVRVILFHTL